LELDAHGGDLAIARGELLLEIAHFGLRRVEVPTQGADAGPSADSAPADGPGLGRWRAVPPNATHAH
jgi:hypothetical protein